MKTYKLNLTDPERSALRRNRVKVSDLRNYTADELNVILGASEDRAKEIAALIEFQQVPSVGPKFAADLVSLGYYSLSELSEQEGPELLNTYERKQGYRTDPCVEDQFWLVAHYARHKSNKNWWDFTQARKAYRSKNGYPADRPGKNWFEMPQYA